MTPWEWWAEFDMRIAENRKMQDMVSGKGKVAGKFTGAEWADARRRFKERKANQ